jgi:hypothetical protein
MQDIELEETSLFYELPLELHPLILTHIDSLSTVGSVSCVCKLWSGLITNDFIREFCIKTLQLDEKFKPATRDWKWTVLSKRPIGPASEEKEEEGQAEENGEESKLTKWSGLGCRRLSFGLYEGEWQDSQRNGVGVFYWSDIKDFEVVYIGEWKGDIRTGRGTCIWNTGDVYTGHWEDDKASGEDGTFFWASGSKYTGGWKEGKQHGKGLFEWKQGDSYDGDWINGKQSGKGTF